MPSPILPDHQGVLSQDTSLDVEQMQIQLWRRMSPAEKLALVWDLRQATLTLAEAGIRQRHPRASMRECFLRLAALTLGAELTRAVYPDAADIDHLGT